MSWKVIKPIPFNPFKINGVEYKNSLELVMRIEELEKENVDLRHNYEQFKAIAEPEIERLQKGNRLLGERCNQLLKDKGDLTDRVEELQEQNSEMFNTIALQEQQIEKMKCCANCSKYDRYNRMCSRTRFSVIEILCNCLDNWELREIKE